MILIKESPSEDLLSYFKKIALIDYIIPILLQTSDENLSILFFLTQSLLNYDPIFNDFVVNKEQLSSLINFLGQKISSSKLLEKNKKIIIRLYNRIVKYPIGKKAICKKIPKTLLDINFYLGLNDKDKKNISSFLSYFKGNQKLAKILKDLSMMSNTEISVNNELNFSNLQNSSSNFLFTEKQKQNFSTNEMFSTISTNQNTLNNAQTESAVNEERQITTHPKLSIDSNPFFKSNLNSKKKVSLENSQQNLKYNDNCENSQNIFNNYSMQSMHDESQYSYYYSQQMNNNSYYNLNNNYKNYSYYNAQPSYGFYYPPVQIQEEDEIKKEN